MKPVLVDSNVLLDVMTEDPVWHEWSADMLRTMARTHALCINPVIFAEVSIRFTRIEELDAALPPRLLERLPTPFETAFLAGKCFVDYRRRGGTRASTLPDFFIGAHAAVARMTLLTRDTNRYRTYFPRLDLVAPDT